MPDLGRGRRLAPEALDVPLAEREPAGHHLQRDAAVQRPLVGQVDDAHAAAAELVLDHEVAEAATAGLRRFAGRPLLVAQQAVEGQEAAALGEDLLLQVAWVACHELTQVRRAAGRVQVDELFDRLLHGGPEPGAGRGCCSRLALHQEPSVRDNRPDSRACARDSNARTAPSVGSPISAQISSVSSSR